MKKALPVIILILAVIIVVFVATGIVNKGERDNRRIIAIVLPRTGSCFCESFRRGASGACEAMGFKLRMIESGGRDQRRLQDRLSGALHTQGVCGVILAGLEGGLPEALAEEVLEARMPCVVVGTREEAYKQPYRARCCVGPDEYISGLIAARRMAEILGDKERLAVLNCGQESGLTGRRENGFVHTIRNEFKGIQLVETKHGPDDVEGAFLAAQRLLKENPDIAGLFACDQTASLGALRALEKDPRAGRIKVVGFGAQKVLVEAVGSGAIDSLVVHNGCVMGREAVGALIAAIKGEEIAGRIDVRVVVVTRENLDDPEIQELTAAARE
ncbi:MAG: substrate-binding domain-containing protein [Phycisphaerales bacterium]|nr:MAG: substrate-binding domain-containing protein [Phycisphaerales bacterium]